MVGLAALQYGLLLHQPPQVPCMFCCPVRVFVVQPMFMYHYQVRLRRWLMAKTPAWQRAEGKNPKGGLNAKGRASYNAANPGKPGLKRPQPEGGARRDSFCARMKGMKSKLTSAKTANDPNSRINKSLRAWNCADGGYIKSADGVAQRGKTKGRIC